MFVDTVLPAPGPPNNDDSALALAKLNPIEELGVDDGTAVNVAVADDGVVSTVPTGNVIPGREVVCPIGEAIDLDAISDTGCT